MIIKWAKGRGIQITTIFKFLSFTTVFAQSKVHLSDGIDREYTFQNQTSNLLSISAQGFLRTNIDCWVNWTLLNRNQLWMAYSEFANEISQQTFVLMKTSSRCLQDVLVKTNIFFLSIRLQNVFKTFSRRLQDIFTTPCQDVFKTSRKYVLKTSSRRFEDVSSS